MTQLELIAQRTAQLLEQRNRTFIEDRLLVSQWCASLVKAYDSVTDDVRAKFPPLPGTKAEEMIPSLFVANPSDVDVEQYNREMAVLTNIQSKIGEISLAMNQEAMKCLSQSTPQS